MIVCHSNKVIMSFIKQIKLYNKHKGFVRGTHVYCDEKYIYYSAHKRICVRNNKPFDICHRIHINYEIKKIDVHAEIIYVHADEYIYIWHKNAENTYVLGGEVKVGETVNYLYVTDAYIFVAINNYSYSIIMQYPNPLMQSLKEQSPIGFNLDGCYIGAIFATDTMLYVGLYNGHIHIYNLLKPDAKPLIRKDHTEPINSIFICDNNLVTASAKAIRVWDMIKYHCVNTIDMNNDDKAIGKSESYIYDCQKDYFTRVSAYNNMIVSVSRLFIRLWDIKTLTCIYTHEMNYIPYEPNISNEIITLPSNSHNLTILKIIDFYGINKLLDTHLPPELIEVTKTYL